MGFHTKRDHFLTISRDSLQRFMKEGKSAIDFKSIFWESTVKQW